MKKIAIIGLGYVGLPLAIEFSKKNVVFGYDINQDRILQLKEHIDITNECEKEKLLAAKNLTYTSTLSEIRAAQIYIVTVPTPVTEDKRPDFRPLIEASKDIGAILKKGDIVVFESTVFPGATEEICIPLLEETSGFVLNRDFFCGYSPERINPGDKTHSICEIKKITSGSNSHVAEEIDVLYREIITAGTWKAPSIRVAEAAKVIENAQRDLNIAFMNELSIIFNELGIDTQEVLDAAGSKWNFLPFKPGLVGGHCISVDPYYLTHKAERVGYYPELILAGRRVNEKMSIYAATQIMKLLIKQKTDNDRLKVLVMGVTFKDNCPDIRNSKVFELIDELKSWGALVDAEDPLADEQAVKNEYNISLQKKRKHQHYDAIVIAVAHDEYKKIDFEVLKSLMRTQQPLLADLKSIKSKSEAVDAGFSVFRL